MKTEVVMVRSIMGMDIRQKHKSGFFSVSDLERFANQHRITNSLPIQKVTDYFRSPKSKEFIELLEKEYGDCQIGGKGRGKEKWIHPYLFIDIALWYSPELKIKVYDWIYDNLLIFRDNSGESFKNMTKAISENCKIRGRGGLIFPKVARAIYRMVGVSGENKWEKSTSDQLKLRDEIQTAITTATYFCEDIESILRTVSKNIYKK